MKNRPAYLMRIMQGVLLALVISILVAVPVLALSYTISLVVREEDGNDYSMLAIHSMVDNAWMAANGFMQADALDTLLTTEGGQVKPHMSATNRTIYALPVPADSWTNLVYTTGNSDLPSMHIISGYGGFVTIPDDASLELGGDFKIDMFVYIDTDSGANKNIVYKLASVVLYVSNTEEITLAITGGPTLVVTGVPSGEYFIRVWANGTDVSLYIE